MRRWRWRWAGFWVWFLYLLHLADVADLLVPLVVRALLPVGSDPLLDAAVHPLDEGVLHLRGVLARALQPAASTHRPQELLDR